MNRLWCLIAGLVPRDRAAQLYENATSAGVNELTGVLEKGRVPLFGQYRRLALPTRAARKVTSCSCVSPKTVET